MIVIEDAEMQGLIHPNSGSRIFEGTVGSTGISIATIARARFVPLILIHLPCMLIIFCVCLEATKPVCNPITLDLFRADFKFKAIIMPDDVAAEKERALLALGATVEKVRPASIVDKKQACPFPFLPPTRY